jgi:uncharacterized protein (TIGR04141 family)
MNTFTIYQLKDNISDPEAALDPNKRFRRIGLTGDLGLPGTLYIGSQHRATPQWVNMLNPHLEQEIQAVYTASISAVLIVQYQDRFFALPFGYGRTLLTPHSWVRDFGLKVTLNKIDPNKIRSIDSKIYDDLVVSTRKQTSQSSKLGSFELDVNRALLRGVTGEADEHDIFTRITGSGPVRVTTELAFTRLADILDELVEGYADDAYQQHFPWVDNVKAVDPVLNAELDQRLTAALAANDLAGAYLAAPEIVDWETIHRFSYTEGGGVLYLELSLPEYLAILEDHDIPVTAEVLKRHRVLVQYDGSDELHKKWSIYECLVWETTIQQGRFVLLDGIWFEIAANYAAEVLDYVGAISSTDIHFPNAILGQGEGVYNEAVEAEDPDLYAMLDRENFYANSAATSIEFCDLFSTAGHFIHVKKRTSSGTLSHLFSQGSVSSDLFLQDSQLRDEVRQKLIELNKPAHAALIPANRPTSSDYEVVYAIIAAAAQAGWPPPLPFFSSVNLMHHARRVQNLGFDVSLQYIRQGN